MKFGILALCVCLVGCAGYSRVREYPAHWGGNYKTIEADGRKFNVKHHPAENALLVQPTLLRTTGAGLASLATLGVIDDDDMLMNAAPWEQAATIYLEGRGCAVDGSRVLTDVSYEIFYSCE